MSSTLIVTTPKVVTPIIVRLDSMSSMADLFTEFLTMPYPVLLDSASKGTGRGPFSYLSADPFMVLRSKGRRVEISTSGATQHLDSDPFLVLRDLLKRYDVAPAPGLPPFQGGAIGYLAYELAHHLERLTRHAVDDLDLPEMIIGFYDWLIARDHRTNTTWIVSTGLPEGEVARARDRLSWVQDRLKKAHSSSSSPSLPFTVGSAKSNFSAHAYFQAVSAVKDYIRRGDVYQANISQRFETDLTCEPWELYLRLRKVNPAPYAAFLKYPEVAILSSSPEGFLRMEDGFVHTRPMKGTRPRGRTPTEDRHLAAELRSSEKDRAENVMIVDVLRNDLGKVCTPGTIEAPELLTIEKHPKVFQMVSAVRGRPGPGVDAVDVLRACFPGGSVTGAPKIRAMEIIDELEPTQRSVYCGAIGYMGFNGSMHTCIPIRTLLVKGRRVYFQVGGGIVADSEPQAEYEETLHKARGSLEALGVQV